MNWSLQQHYKFDFCQELSQYKLVRLPHVMTKQVPPFTSTDVPGAHRLLRYQWDIWVSFDQRYEFNIYELCLFIIAIATLSSHYRAILIIYNIYIQLITCNILLCKILITLNLFHKKSTCSRMRSISCEKYNFNHSI